MVDNSLIKAIIKGLISYLPGVSLIIDNRKIKSGHSGSSPVFCYSLWLSILVHLSENDVKSPLSRIGEIGNGNSFGIGLCALLTGTKKYYSIELNDHVDIERELLVLDELILLLKNRTPIPDYFNQINLKIGNYNYPDQLIEKKYLDQDFISELRNEIKTRFSSTNKIIIVKKWSQIPSLKLDFIFSKAVMEHVKNPDRMYQDIEKHLIDNSYMFHDIDLHSHGITRRSNGHLDIPDRLWKIIYGNRKFFLNRWIFEDHLNSIQNKSFAILKIQQTSTTIENKSGKVIHGATILASKNS